jgi:hypothetical protein
VASIRAITRCESCAILSTGFVFYSLWQRRAKRSDLRSLVHRSAGNRHSIEVAAESLYEAAPLAEKEFRGGYRAGHSDAAGGQNQVSNATHEVSISQREKWLANTQAPPRDRPVRELLGPKG